jgi:hypothetical protein
MDIQIKEGSAVYSKIGEENIIDFGIIPINTHPTIVVRFTGTKLKNFLALPVCGCTTVETTVVAESIVDLKITYTATKERRPFSKVVKTMFKENGKQTNINFKIKGNIL